MPEPVNLIFFDLDRTQSKSHIGDRDPQALYDNSTDTEPSVNKARGELKEGLAGKVHFDSRTGHVFAGVTYNPNPKEWLAFQKAMLGEDYEIHERLHHNAFGRATSSVSQPKVIRLPNGGIFIMRKYTVFKNGVEDPVPLILLHLPGEDYFQELAMYEGYLASLPPGMFHGRENMGAGYQTNYDKVHHYGKNKMLKTVLAYLCKKLKRRDVTARYYDDDASLVYSAAQHAVLGGGDQYYFVLGVADMFKAQLCHQGRVCFDTQGTIYAIDGEEVIIAPDQVIHDDGTQGPAVYRRADRQDGISDDDTVASGASGTTSPVSVSRTPTSPVLFSAAAAAERLELDPANWLEV